MGYKPKQLIASAYLSLDKVAIAPLAGVVVHNHEGAAVIHKGPAGNLQKVHVFQALAGHIKMVDAILIVDDHIG